MTGVRYLVVSGICMAVHVTVLIVADRAGLPLAAAFVLSFAIVVAIGYLLHARVTFSIPPGAASFSHYVLAMAAMIPVSAACLWLFARGLAWPMPLAAPTGTLASAAVNFLLVRRSFSPRASIEQRR